MDYVGGNELLRQRSSRTGALPRLTSSFDSDDVGGHMIDQTVESTMNHRIQVAPAMA